MELIHLISPISLIHLKLFLIKNKKKLLSFNRILQLEYCKAHAHSSMNNLKNKEIAGFLSPEGRNEERPVARNPNPGDL
ncbi:hypothetical protein EUTSA_v10015577mg [Eutrema salsugineum]|uniref:Uncharacterized protein n=1 Tax=Eutrema salsugineum TaxID=72664 RepID=V4LGK8_EUTSA|nr:hypothetical protein EUTSA_v10015577mg [Eutrema salsugineum]